MHAFWLVLTYDLLEDRRIDDVIIKTFLIQLTCWFYLLVVYAIFNFQNNFKNTLRAYSGWLYRRHPMYKNKISLNPQNTCSFKRVLTVLAEPKVIYL